MPAIGALYRRAARVSLRPAPRPGRAARPRAGRRAASRSTATTWPRTTGSAGSGCADTLPATYPHVLAFPLAMRLMSAADFPFPVVGLVHVGQPDHRWRRPISTGERLDLAVRAPNLRPHDRGRQFDVVATATVDGVEVWRGVSTYLRRGDEPRPPEVAAGPDPTGRRSAPTASWRVGRRGRARRTPPSPATATRSTPPGSAPGCSASRGRSRTACGRRPAAWPRWRAGCRTRTRSTSRSSARPAAGHGRPSARDPADDVRRAAT